MKCNRDRQKSFFDPLIKYILSEKTTLLPEEKGKVTRDLMEKILSDENLDIDNQLNEIISINK